MTKRHEAAALHAITMTAAALGMMIMSTLLNHDVAIGEHNARATAAGDEKVDKRTDD